MTCTSVETSTVSYTHLVTAKPVPEAVPEVDEPEEKPASKGFAPWAVVLVIALIAAGAGTGGYFLYRHFSE